MEKCLEVIITTVLGLPALFVFAFLGGIATSDHITRRCQLSNINKLLQNTAREYHEQD